MFALVIGSWGCFGTSLEPIPGGQFVGEKADEALEVRFTGSGFAFLNQHWPLLAEALAPGGHFSVPLACTHERLSLGILGAADVFVADQGGPAGGRNDGLCDGRDTPASVEATVTGLSVLARPPDQIELGLAIAIDTGKIYVTNPYSAFGFTCDLKCSFGYSAGTRAPPENALSLGVRLRIDTAWDRLLSFEVDSVGGTQICGAAGASAPPSCLDPTDFSMSDEGSCPLFGWACDLLNVAAVKTFVFQQLSPALEASVMSMLATQRCRPCTDAASSCPNSTDGSRRASVCTGGVCVDPRGGCVPRFLGVEGRWGFGGVDSGVDVSFAAGSRVTVDDGLTLGTRVGIRPVQRASCVPPVEAPGAGSASPVDFASEASPGLKFDLALSASGGLFDRALWAVHQSGNLCLTLDSASSSVFNTGLVKTLIPSVGVLAGRDGLDAPMMGVLRPLTAPRVVIQAGGVDPVSGLARSALKVALADLSVDLYALIDDRMLRVLTVTSDVSAPMSFAFPGCDRVKPELGQIELTNIRTTSGEALEEDAQGLSLLLTSVGALAGSAIAQGLGELILPKIGGLQLEPLEAKGLRLVDGARGTYELLGFFARLRAPDEPACAVP